MPYRLACPRCRKKGFIRTERVFTGMLACTAFFCGICMHEWQERDPPRPETPARSARPSRPRRHG